MNRRNLKKVQGFSLVEICIVCGVLAVLMLPVFMLMSRGSSVTVRNRNEVFAQQYAMNIISYCNLAPFDGDFMKDTEEKVVGDLTILLGNTTIDLDITEEGFSKIAKRTIAIKTFTPTTPWTKRYKIVTVKVEWQQPGEPAKRNVTISGLVYNT